MAAYHYIAINPAGKELKGVIEADGEKQARQMLRDKSYIPLRLSLEKTNKPTDEKKYFQYLSKRKSLSSKELALITRQFATLLSAGLPIEEALLAVSEQTEKNRIKGLLLSVRSKVMEGHALASAMRDHPEAFSSLFCATIAAGEKTGHLDKVLLRLADYTEQQSTMKQKLSTALIYPSMIVLVSFGIVGFLLEYVVPKMVAVYGHLNQALPFMTTALISISNYVGSYGGYTLLAIILGIIIFRMMLKKSNSFRAKVHHHLLKVPLIGYTIKTSNTARFSRTLSILCGAGVSILEAMTISAQLVTHIPIREAILNAVGHVREGKNINLALKQTTYFSPMSVHMIASGESSGQLEPMLERVAIQQEDEITRLMEVALSLFEPAVILLMGAIVLFIVLAVLLPIFNLNEFTG